DRLGGLPDPAATCASWLSRGRDRWPQLAVDPADFLEHLVTRLPLPADAPTLRKLDVEGLYIALACLRGQPGAIQAFERAYFPGLEPTLARLGSSGALSDEVKQALRVKLFFQGPRGGPKLSEFAGR